MAGRADASEWRLILKKAGLARNCRADPGGRLPHDAQDEASEALPRYEGAALPAGLRLEFADHGFAPFDGRARLFSMTSTPSQLGEAGCEGG